MPTIINTTKDNLKAALIAEFAPEGFAPADIRALLLTIIDDIVSEAMAYRGDWHGNSAYLDAVINATA